MATEADKDAHNQESNPRVSATTHRLRKQNKQYNKLCQATLNPQKASPHLSLQTQLAHHHLSWSEGRKNAAVSL